MIPRSHRLVASGLVLVTGCVLSPAVTPVQLDLQRNHEDSIAQRAPVATHRKKRVFQVRNHHVDGRAELQRATAHVVKRSECTVDAPPLCAASGSCLGSVLVHGDVCVLMVRAVATDGHSLDPYCHDLSVLALVPSRSTLHARDSAWAECVADLPL